MAGLPPVPITTCFILFHLLVTSVICIHQNMGLLVKIPHNTEYFPRPAHWWELGWDPIVRGQKNALAPVPGQQVIGPRMPQIWSIEI